MRVAITGATGNVGTSLLRSLAGEAEVHEILGIARRRPEVSFDKTTWVAADVAKDDLRAVFEGCDAVVHLAWLIQPSRDESVTHGVNVDGSKRVFEAAADAGVRNIIYASSIGAYSPAPIGTVVDESWPTHGVPTSFYSRHKAAVERILDTFAARHPNVRIVRLRPGLIFKAEAASGIRRLFAGPLLPPWITAPSRLPLIPHIPGLTLQAVHSDDVADAYRRALVTDVSGAFNVAAEPVLDTGLIARALGKRTIRVPANVVRRLALVTWKLRLQPTPPGWLDLGMQGPVMDTTAVRARLGWEARVSALDALAELLEGLARSAGGPTPPLHPHAGGPLRIREWLTGVGRRSR
ncbi:MAG TPA: NAD-dependent epimerase/dehydratase family protein [Actinomycetota bacterium]|nr:NAD-dependent epimerase/dehydratase family protein [Actinomycetota bacterium]